jgi:hypothetical protein
VVVAESVFERRELCIALFAIANHTTSEFGNSACAGSEVFFCDSTPTDTTCSHQDERFGTSESQPPREYLINVDLSNLHRKPKHQGR